MPRGGRVGPPHITRARSSFNALDMFKQLTTFGGGFDVTDLKAYFVFDEASGDLINRATDAGSSESLGSAADGQNTGVTQDQAGLIDKSYLYDNNDDLTDLGSSKSQFNFMHNSSALWTLNFWLKATTSADTGDLLVYFADGTGATAQKSVVLFRDDRGGQNRDLELLMGKGSSPLAVNISIGGFFPADTDFHMVTIRYDESLASDQALIRIDDGTDTAGSKAADLVDGDAGFVMRIAQLPNNTQFACDANLDEMSIWNRILTDEEITELFNGGSGLSLL